MSKTILITGASTGIGAETARHLALGNEVLIHCHMSRPQAEAVAAEVQRLGGKARVFQADLCGESGCRSLFQEVSDEVDHLDALINNAGGMIRRQPCRQFEWDFMLQSFALNTFSAMMMSSLCLPLLEKGSDPCIINVSSIAMRHGAAGATIYAATKGAIDTFTRGLAKELAPAVRVNAVAPGVIATPFHEKVSTPEQMKAWREAAPLKRNGEARHIAQTIRFIIENDFLTGETIDVNGGMFMR